MDGGVADTARANTPVLTQAVRSLDASADNTERPRSLKLQWYPDSSQRHNTVIPFFWKLIETERETSHTVPLRPSPSLSCLSGTVTTLVTAQSGAEQRTETVIPFWNEIDGIAIPPHPQNLV
jgi:hypothetical protein